MILYLFIAPSIKDHFTVQKGKPVLLDEVSHESSDLIRFGFGSMIKSRQAGQILHQVQGWSFIDNGVDQNSYDVFLVLTSQSSKYYYPVMMKGSVNLNKGFPDVKIDLSNSGFNCLIAQETLKNGTYDVEILFKEKSSGRSYYSLTSKILIKTFNNILLQDR